MDVMETTARAENTEIYGHYGNCEYYGLLQKVWKLRKLWIWKL